MEYSFVGSDRSATWTRRRGNRHHWSGPHSILLDNRTAVEECLCTMPTRASAPNVVYRFHRPFASNSTVKRDDVDERPASRKEKSESKGPDETAKA